MTSTLYQQIQQFYDASSALWEHVWGEHMHHGYYGADGKQKKDRRQAQIDLIDELLKWSGVELGTGFTRPYDILDVGCGIGGSSLYLLQSLQGIQDSGSSKEKDYNAESLGTSNRRDIDATATGITLSPVQASRARERAAAARLSHKTNFLVADALNLPFPDASFDLVWSMESGEHMPDKVKFLQECYRVLKPGGTFLMATWCHRPTTPPEGYLTPDELKHLAEIYRVYCLPYVISLPEYEAIAGNLPFQNIRTADWSQAVAPFWDIVIDSLLNPSVILGLILSGWTTIQGALSLSLMSQGYQRGLIRYGLLCATK